MSTFARWVALECLRRWGWTLFLIPAALATLFSRLLNPSAVRGPPSLDGQTRAEGSSLRG
ncbi:MAG: hypothetical protein QXR87_04480 [Candidatus Hadarchaeales archaeon]